MKYYNRAKLIEQKKIHNNPPSRLFFPPSVVKNNLGNEYEYKKENTTSYSYSFLRKS
jgi:hypothetical protein